METRASVPLEGDIHLLNMKGSTMHTGCMVFVHWRGLLVTGSVMSEAADRVSVVGFRRLPFIHIGKDGTLFAIIRWIGLGIASLASG